jgi:hypothetical protein
MERRQVHCKIRQESWQHLDRYVRRQGVTIAALIDTLAAQLAGEPAKLDLTTAVEEARIVDGERRRRG